jgi:hypothetical protein
MSKIVDIVACCVYIYLYFLVQHNIQNGWTFPFKQENSDSSGAEQSLKRACDLHIEENEGGTVAPYKE